MSLCGTDQNKQRLIKRLNRIEGQVRGLSAMIEKERDCIEVLRQIASVNGALRGVWTQVLEDHLNGCIAKSMLDKKNAKNLVPELIDLLRKVR